MGKLIKFSEEKNKGNIIHLIPVHMNRMKCKNYFWDWSNEHGDWIRGEKIKNLVKQYTEKEIQEIAKNMIAYGGSFFSNLGKCLQVADLENEKIILSQWSKQISNFSKY
jgi:hypothetical protein